MKKVFLIIIVCISLFIFGGASIWEGVAELSNALPETGRYIATNSFPINTVVDVTNLGTGQIGRLIVVSGIESPGFLALLSRDAADVLGVQDGSLARIRMVQDPDPLAYSRFIIENGFISLPGITEELILVPADDRPAVGAPEPDPSYFVAAVDLEPVSQVPDESYFIAGITPEPENLPAVIEPAMVIPPVTVEPFRSASRFSVPVIHDLERGMFYIQIAAFAQAENVEYAIATVDNSLPVAVMSAGTITDPLYRVLIGPLNLGESGAVLQRYRRMYRDAFVRQGARD